MKILIDVNKMYYEMLKHDVEVNHNDYLPCALIARGTPLPEHHGRLIDVDELYEKTEICHSDIDGYACVRWKDINDAPTIIEGSESEW